MQNDPRQAAELEALEACLDVHGPDAARWPPALQQRFAALRRDTPEAQRMLREAAALERLMQAGGPPDPQRLQRLHASVMQAATANMARSNVLPLLRQPQTLAVAPPVRVPGRPRLLDTRARLALAASLVLGIIAGATGLPDAAWTPDLSVAMASDGQSDEGELAFGNGTGDLDVEDFL